MTYGHAERNLAVIRRLEAETEQLILSLEYPVPEQSAWLEQRAADGTGSYVSNM
jgi:hypothetical protein